MERKKIAFISASDAKDPKNLSGAPYYISHYLKELYSDVDCLYIPIPKKITYSYLLTNIFTCFVWIYIYGKIKELFYRICFRKRYLWDWSILFSKYCARKINKLLIKNDYFLIFSEKSSTRIAFIGPHIPIIYESDAVFAAMIDYYPGFCNLAKISIKNGNTIERLALEKSSLFIANSDWAARSASDNYGISPDKILVLPFPSFIDALPKEIVLADKNSNICRLLFVGVEWERKGGDIAVETVNELNAAGIKSELTICGCLPPSKYLNNKFLNVVGFLDKNIEADRDRLQGMFLNAHFFILPTKAECMGLVFSEAACYGLPILATKTGGVASVVHDNENGFLLSSNANGKDFADCVTSLWNDKDKYDLFRRNSRNLFEREFSKEAWTASIKRAIDKVLRCSI